MMSQSTNDQKSSGYPVKSAIVFVLFVGAALLICGLLNSYSEGRQAPQNYFAGQNPYRFHITDPHVILWVVSLLLAIPPLPLIHAWLLNQVWHYMAPFDEQQPTLRLAVGVAIATSALIAIGAAFWMYDANADLLGVGSIVTALTVIIGVVVAVRTARHRQFTDSFVRKLGLATGLISLIVPVSVFAAPFTSPVNSLIGSVGLLLIFGFIAYRRALNGYLDKLESRVTIWQTDRLALEVLLLFLLMLAPVGALFTLIEQALTEVLIIGRLEESSFFCLWPLLSCLLPVIGIPLIGALGLRLYTRWRGRDWVVKKKASPLQLHTAPLFGGNDWFRLLFWHTVIWLSKSIIVIVIYAAILNDVRTRLLSGL